MSEYYPAPRYVLWLKIEDAELGKPEVEGGHLYYQFTHMSRSNENAGVDLVTAETFAGDGPHLLDLGVRAMMTRKDTGEAVHYWLAPRSSVFKTGYMMANSMGVIDRSYRGVLKAPVVQTNGHGGHGFRRGDRHFQILAPDMGWIENVYRVDELPATLRGDGGFGSTGR